MKRADGRKTSVRAWQGGNPDPAHACVEYRHVHRAGVTPEAQQGPISGRQLTCGKAPAILVHDDPWPRTMSRDFVALDRVDQPGHWFTLGASPRSETKRPVPAAYRRRQPAPTPTQAR